MKLRESQVSISGSHILTVGFNGNSSNYILVSLFIVGTHQNLFNISKTNHTITTNTGLDAGRYQFIVAGLAFRKGIGFSTPLTAPVFVDIIAQG